MEDIFDTCYAQIGLYSSGNALMRLQACRRRHIDLFNDALASTLIKAWPGFQALGNAGLVMGSVRSYYVRHCRLEIASDPLLSPVVPDSLHVYALLVELVTAQRMVFVNVFQGIESLRVDFALTTRGLQDLAEAVVPQFRELGYDLSSFDSALLLSLTIVRIADGWCMRLCRRTAADNSAEPGNVNFYPVDLWDEEESDGSDGDAGYASAELDIKYNISDDDTYTVINVSLQYDLNFESHFVLDSHPSRAAIVHLWDAQGTWV